MEETKEETKSSQPQPDLHGLWTDQPILGATHDQLNFSHYADVLTNVVLTADTPITIGVFGPWGSGKTSLMRLVAEQLLNRRTTTHRWARVVWFNAWQYERDQGALWRALLLRVLEGLESDADQLNPEDAAQIEDWRTRLYTDVQRSETGSLQIDWPKLGKGALRLGLSLVPTPGTLTELLQFMKGEMGTLEDIVAAFQRERTEIYRRQLTLLEEFQGGFAHLVREYVWGRNGLLVVFIDDLDRCLPNRAIEVLEAIKLFLDVSGCVFFIAVDRDIIEQVVRVQYTGYMEDTGSKSAPVAGQSYLEKIVQLPFHLPPLEDDQIAAFIDQHDPRLPPGCRDIFSCGLEPNPRVAKRTMNIFRLLLQLSEHRVTAGTMGPVSPELLAKMVVIQARYHDLYRDLLEYPNLIQDLERAAREGMEVQQAVSPLIEERPPETVTLLERYLRYKPLLRMLRTPPSFSDLTRSQINAYIYLTRATSEKSSSPTEMEAARVWQDLLSGDVTRIRAAVATIQRDGTADKYVAALVRLLDASVKATVAERISAGASLAYLGDPRDFDEMVDIPGGEFKQGEKGEPVYVMAYRIGRYPVTNAQYARFLDDHPDHPVPCQDEVWAEPYNWDARRRTFPLGKANHPVVLVNREDALAYCAWAGVRLPTDAEWEKAARGEDGRVYPWGDAFTPEQANVRESGIGSTTPVGVYPQGTSPYGLFDCAGNVWEWTSSHTDDQDDDDEAIIRGGSWNFHAEDARCFVRETSQPGYRSNRIGFRVVTGPQPSQHVVVEPAEDQD
jgi:formylglycine-generating enzyme required for sulfatase activity